VTTGATRRTKLQSNHHHQQTNIQLLPAGCPSCCPTNSVKATRGTRINPLLLISIFPCVPGDHSRIGWVSGSRGWHSKINSPHPQFLFNESIFREITPGQFWDFWQESVYWRDTLHVSRESTKWMSAEDQSTAAYVR